MLNQEILYDLFFFRRNLCGLKIHVILIKFKNLINLLYLEKYEISLFFIFIKRT